MGLSGVTHIYFDWSGTLARCGTTHLMSGSLHKKRATLYADTLETLAYLRGRGYKVGLISNSDHPPVTVMAALHDIGVGQYLNGAVVFGGSICKKPCAAIFKAALQRDKVAPQHAIMIGNKYTTDINGAKGVGMQWVLIDKSKHADVGARRIHSLSQLKQIL